MLTPAQLTKHLTPLLDASLSWQSRIHPVSRYFDGVHRHVYLKRDDELSSGVIGAKWRKYLSILPVACSPDYDEVVVVGSAHSNNVCGLVQCLIERGVNVAVWVKQPGDQQAVGNWLFTQMMLGQDKITRLNHTDWPLVESLGRTYVTEQLSQGKRVLWLPEGGFSPAVVAGSLTLALDVIRNEAESGQLFHRIYTDAGTGVTAFGLLMGLRLLGRTDCELFITQIANDQAGFEQRYRTFETWTNTLLGVSDLPDVRYQHLKPVTAKSYGSINQTVLQETKNIAQDTGVLMEPLYSVKHMMTTRQHLSLSPRASGAVLVLNNGGALGLAGFQSRLLTTV